MRIKVPFNNEFSRGDFLLKPSQAGVLLSIPAMVQNSMSQNESQKPGHKIAVFSKHLQWLGYRDYPLNSGEYINLNDIVYDKPETHVGKKDDMLYYAFFCTEMGG